MSLSSSHRNFILFAMGLITLVILGYGIKQSLSPLGSTDFHSYWYYGHFVRQGSDPYLAYFNQAKPHLPVKYMNGTVANVRPIAKPQLAHTPANTAPIVLLLSLFSLFSWETAKLIWMVINLALTLLIPWMIIHLLPSKERLTLFHTCLVFFFFFILQGTRIANWVGQTTLLVFVLMLSSLLSTRKNRILSGVLLGIALSKYSLAISVFLFLLFKQNYKVLAISLVIQIIGILSVALLGKHSPLLTVKHYLQMMGHHTALPGIHLANLFPPENMWALITVVLGSLGFFIFLWMNRTRFGDQFFNSDGKLTFADWHLLSSLVLWSLLVVYHRAYDTLTVIVFIALIGYGIIYSLNWNISYRQKQVLYVFFAVFIGIMSIPSSLMRIIFSPEIMIVWYQWVSYATTFALITALIVNLWLLKRIPSTQQAET